jgi:hypothetical protein
MPAQVDGDHAVGSGEMAQLVMPLGRLTGKAMHKDDCALGVIRRDVDGRKTHQGVY